MGINAYRKTASVLMLLVELHCLPAVLLAHAN